MFLSSTDILTTLLRGTRLTPEQIAILTYYDSLGKENYRFGKVLTKHGHEGKSGRRVDFLALAQVYNHYVDGHGHSPCAYRNAVRVGTTSNLRPGYAIGASGWLGANAIINDDASVQLLPIIEGRWRL